jgi:hypothetical protein
VVREGAGMGAFLEPSAMAGPCEEFSSCWSLKGKASKESAGCSA